MKAQPNPGPDPRLVALETIGATGRAVLKFEPGTIQNAGVVGDDDDSTFTHSIGLLDSLPRRDAPQRGCRHRGRGERTD